MICQLYATNKWMTCFMKMMIEKARVAMVARRTVRMKHLGRESNARRLVGVLLGKCHFELVDAALPRRLVRSDDRRIPHHNVGVGRGRRADAVGGVFRVQLAQVRGEAPRRGGTVSERARRKCDETGRRLRRWLEESMIDGKSGRQMRSPRSEPCGHDVEWKYPASPKCPKSQSGKS